MEEVVLKVKVEGSGDSEAKVKSIKQQLREAKEAALQAKEGTEEYFQALNKAAGLADKLGDVNKAVNALDPGAKAQAFGTLISAVAGGFQTITGLYGLLGEKSEEVEKLLLKVQSASAIAMGVQSLVEAQKQWTTLSAAIKTTTLYQALNTLATKAAVGAQILLRTALGVTSIALNTLRGAILATGIGALVVGVGILIYKISEWTSETDDHAKSEAALRVQLEANLKVYQDTKTQLELINTQTDLANKRNIDLARSTGANAGVIAALQNKAYKDQIKGLNDLKDATAVAYAQLTGYRAEFVNKLVGDNDLLIKELGYGSTYTKNLGKDNAEQAKKYLTEIIGINNTIANVQNQSVVDKNNLDLKTKEDAEKRAKELLDKLTKNEEDITNLSKDELLKRQENAKKEYDAFVGLLRVKRDEAWAIEDATTLKIKEELQKRRDAERASDDERAAAEQQAFEDRKERIEAGFQLAQAAANSLNTLNNIITENEKRGLKEGEVLSVETQKKAFKRAQGLALIQTTINGAQAISSILGQYPKFDGGFAMVAALVSATAAIASQYAVIASQKFNPEGGGGSGSPSAPMGMNGGGGFNAPSIQPPSNTSGLIQEGENFKVYVVESDITNSQMGVQQNKKKALITI
jgi:hypothetical protein